MFLDAECAWYGDPVFDLAFCLNHLLLKCLWRPQWSAALSRLLRCARQRLSRRRDLGAARADRGAHRALLPGLFLARVDGKSPVEYVTEDWQRDAVRRTARALLQNPPMRSLRSGPLGMNKRRPSPARRPVDTTPHA